MPPAAATQRTQGKRPGDLTGVRGQQLAKSRDAQHAETKAQIAESLQAERLAERTQEVDYSSEGRKQAREAASAGVVEEGDFEVRPKTKRIRVNWEIQDMTFGREVVKDAEYDEHGNMTTPPVLGGLRVLNFKPGPWYTVDYDVFEHLAYLGYVFDL